MVTLWSVRKSRILENIEIFYFQPKLFPEPRSEKLNLDLSLCVYLKWSRWSISIGVSLLLHTDRGMSLMPLYQKLNWLEFE